MSTFTGTMFQTGATPVLEEAMKFSENRHRLILSNIANADTPGYRRQDLDTGRFRSMLSDAIQDRDRMHPGTFTMGRSAGYEGYKGGRDFRPFGQPAYPRIDSALRHDENNVSLEREMALMARNSGAYSQLAGLYSKGLRQMRAAITERPET